MKLFTLDLVDTKINLKMWMVKLLKKLPIISTQTRAMSSMAQTNAQQQAAAPKLGLFSCCK